MNKSQPIRMCISCRERQPQGSMLRLKMADNEIIAYDGSGRSFYLCDVCSKNQKKIKGLIKRFKQDEERFLKLLEELIKNG
ncbi:DUF448 domain-containing protein [Sulfurovum sp.]|uniref:DUF448 domain-containing protein n=1 Tax=Sulfurovum sp. TaxID=1969726 RepID=UPI002A36EC45|nr:DUF448 domain-containing protein [Sulfurovum sp.]MDY0403039.1 DUF448 domain-containing protein [Sulfurovum sp.]